MREKRAGRLQDFQLKPFGSFESLIRKTDSCWVWTGMLNKSGYGIYYDRQQRSILRAHRLAYQMWVGPIPNELVIMHTCDNPPCVNPSHLQIGTLADNNRDAARKQRTQSGSHHWNSKLSDEAVKDILQGTELQRVLAQRYGVKQSCISRIRAGIRRKSHP